MKQAKAAFGSWGPIEQALLFIEPDGINTEAGLFGYFADLDPAPAHAIPDILWSRLQSQVAFFNRYC